MGKTKEYELKVPIEGETYILKTDLICNSCKKELKEGDYLYFCMNEKDDLCSSYNCLKKHAGHRFFRWGKIEAESPKARTEPEISTTSSLEKAPIPPTPSLPPIGVPAAPAAGPPSPPIKGPTIKTGPASLISLRDDMLRELRRLKKIMKGE